MKRITVSLSIDEKTALTKLAQIERRRIESQAALLIRQELEKQGLLKPQILFFSREVTSC